MVLAMSISFSIRRAIRLIEKKEAPLFRAMLLILRTKTLYLTLSLWLDLACVRKKNEFESVFLLLLISNLGNNGLESLGVVQGEVGEHLAVNLDTSLSQLTHEY